MKFLFFNFFSDRITEGGPTFMYTILICLLVCVGLIVKAFLKGDTDGKVKKLINHISLFALIFGFLGFMTGMIECFDAITRATSINTSVLAGGLKVGLLSPTFGMFTFLIARIGLIGLTLRE
jgi:hypothetical protein